MLSKPKRAYYMAVYPEFRKSFWEEVLVSQAESGGYFRNLLPTMVMTIVSVNLKPEKYN